MRWLGLVLLSGCTQLFGLKQLPGPDAAPPPGAWASVQIGARHACALDRAGNLACWGDPVAGGGTITPTRVGTATWSEISAGGRHTCGVSDGHALCWGSNANAQLTGAFGPDSATPTQVPLPAATPPVDHVAAGMFHSCALAAGQLWCWGRSDLIGGSMAQVPVQLAAGTTFTSVSAGFDHSCAIDSDGGVWCWGRDDAGQSSGMPCSAGNCTVNEPTKLAMAQPAIAVSAGRQATCAVLGASGQGEIHCWGFSDVVQIGTGVTTPMLATPGSDWTGVAVGNHEACGLRGGSAYCWGHVYEGGLADGVWDEETVLPTATLAAIPADAIALSRSDELDESACAVASGNISCWGENGGGQLAVPGTLHLSPVVIPPPGTSKWDHISMSDHHACAQTFDGSIYCWGRDGVGEISASPCTKQPCVVAMPAPPAVPTADRVIAGAEFTCAEQGTTMTCWGANSSGELATTGDVHMNRFAVNAGMLVGGEVGACVLDGNTNLCWGEGMFTPGAPANVPVLKDVGFGGTAACGVAKTGLRGCWGLPIWGELGDGVNDNTMSPKSWEVGTETSTYSAITTQHGHSCALTTSGGVNCWGTNYNGETSNVMPGGFTLAVRPVATETGTALGNCTAVSTGSTATCAICTGAPLCWGAAPNGNLGNGVESNHVYGATPVSVDTGKAWVEIANGDQHACALAGDATLACWGLGIHGEIGDGSHGSNVPTPIPGPP